MFKSNGLSKTKMLAIALAGTVAVSGLVPVSSAEAGHRKHFKKHHGHHKVVRHKNRRNRNGDLLAAGIVGLAIGALIADSAYSHDYRRPVYDPYGAPRQPTGYGYNAPYQDSYYQDYGYGDRQTLDQYDATYDDRYSDPRNSTEIYRDGPNVINYDELVSVEPWTPGWRTYCTNKYKTFNPRTGTYRGYDGNDHFCVPK